jgi:hypothetical protein
MMTDDISCRPTPHVVSFYFATIVSQLATVADAGNRYIISETFLAIMTKLRRQGTAKVYVMATDNTPRRSLTGYVFVPTNRRVAL